jgi:uncharacterized protein (DUF1499 family)
MQSMTFLDWFTRNWADTDEGRDPALVPLALSIPAAAAIALIETTIRSLPRWHIANINHDEQTLHATHTTTVFRFVDDVHIRVETTGEGCMVHGRSQSRIGKGDLGQNRRNLLVLFRAIERSQATGVKS